MPTVALRDLAEGFAGVSFKDQPTCPICGGSSTVVHKAPNIDSEKRYEFDFRGCSACGHGWIDPMPTQDFLNYLYGKGSRSVIGEWGQSRLTSAERMCAKRELGGAPARYFELGVGQGHLYRLFVEKGWECAGVDPGSWSNKFPNVYGNLADVPETWSANLLVAFDVLEHVTDPVGILTSLRKLAAPGARIYCSTPNRDSARASNDREDWRMLRPIGHVNYYSRKSITLALKTADFEVTHLRATDLFEKRIPRGISDLKAWWIEWSGAGDQWTAVAVAQ